jgi:hypothetical protein
MSELSLRETLLAMGYYETKPTKWLKPVGFHAFSYDEENNKWINWFVDKAGTLSLWESNKFNHNLEAGGSYLFQLKHFEAFTRTDVYSSKTSAFELMSVDL